MTVHYKTREEYDQEDWERFRQKQKEIRERKAAKFLREGYKCKHEGCCKIFKNLQEFQNHLDNHQTQEDLKIAMICNQPGCNGRSGSGSSTLSMWRSNRQCQIP